jgi:hypothetical protein
MFSKEYRDAQEARNKMLRDFVDNAIFSSVPRTSNVILFPKTPNKAHKGI